MGRELHPGTTIGKFFSVPGVEAHEARVHMLIRGIGLDPAARVVDAYMNNASTLHNVHENIVSTIAKELPVVADSYRTVMEKRRAELPRLFDEATRALPGNVEKLGETRLDLKLALTDKALKDLVGILQKHAIKDAKVFKLQDEVKAAFIATSDGHTAGDLAKRLVGKLQIWLPLVKEEGSIKKTPRISAQREIIEYLAGPQQKR